MRAYTKIEIVEYGIGEASKQTFLIKINKYFFSISAFTSIINELKQENRGYLPILGPLIQLRAALSSIADIPEETLLPHETLGLKKIIRQSTTCELYVVIPADSKYYTLQDFIDINVKKSEKVFYPEEKAKYSNMTTKARMAQKLIEQINNILSAQAITPKEREIRGYDISFEEVEKRNVELLRSLIGAREGTLEYWPRMAEFFYDVPGMELGHKELEVDKRTGVIFYHEQIEKRGSEERDSVILDYIYAQPKSQAEEMIILLPTQYNVLPLELSIQQRDLLSGQADRLMGRTQIELFKPCLLEIVKAIKRTTNPQIRGKLLKLYESFKKCTVAQYL